MSLRPCCRLSSSDMVSAVALNDMFYITNEFYLVFIQMSDALRQLLVIGGQCLSVRQCLRWETAVRQTDSTDCPIN